MSRSAGRRSEVRSGDGGTPAVVAGAGGVVFNAAGEVLLLRHRSGAWVFPKGHVDRGESPLAAALREVEEEAGVAARAPAGQGSWTTEYHNDRGQARRITWFRLLTDAAVPVLREAQFPEGAFLAPAEALARLSFPEDRALLAAVLAGAAGAVP